MTTETTKQPDAHAAPCAREQLQGIAVVAASAAVMIGLAFGVMALLTSPAGWATKAANDAVLTSFAMNVGD